MCSFVTEDSLEIIDRKDSQGEAICFVANGELERGVDVSLLLVAWMS